MAHCKGQPSSSKVSNTKHISHYSWLSIEQHWCSSSNASWIPNLCYISWYINGSRDYNVDTEYAYDTLFCNPWTLMSWDCILVPTTTLTRWIDHIFYVFNLDLSNFLQSSQHAQPFCWAINNLNTYAAASQHLLWRSISIRFWGRHCNNFT